MSKIVEVTFTSAHIYMVSTRLYNPKNRQCIAQIAVAQDGSTNQHFYVEIYRLGEFLDFVGVDNFDKVVSTQIHLVEKGRKRIVKIVKSVNNNERFIINNVFNNG